VTFRSLRSFALAGSADPMKSLEYFRQLISYGVKMFQ